MEQLLVNDIGKILKVLERQGATPQSIERAVDSGFLDDVFNPKASFDEHKAFRSVLGLLPNIFRLTVDYDQSLPTMIADGQYDWEDGDIASGYVPTSGTGSIEFDACYFHLNRAIHEREGAILDIQESDKDYLWKPAQLEHLLALGRVFPNDQREFPIVGLGSVIKVFEGCGVPCLMGGTSARSLSLHLCHNVFLPNVRFLAVREVSAV